MNNSLKMPRKGSSYYQLIRQFLEDLFVAEKRRLDKSIGDLIAANNEVRGVQASSFMHEGEVYTSTNFTVAPGAGGAGQRPILHDSLVKKMEFHLRSAKRVAEEKQLIGQIIFKLLSPCEELQTMRDTLPDCLAEMIPALRTLERQGEVGCSISNDTRATKQFNDLLERIEFYAAARLIY